MIDIDISSQIRESMHFVIRKQYLQMDIVAVAVINWIRGFYLFYIDQMVAPHFLI